MNDDFNSITYSLSENARFAIQKADTYAKMYNNGAVQTEHLLLGILAQDTCTGARLLADEGIHLEDAEKTLEKPPVEVREKEMSMMSLTEAVVLTLRMAGKIVQEQGMKIIGTEHILYALINQPTSKAVVMLQKLAINVDQLASSIEELIEKQAEDSKIEDKKAEYKRKSPVKWLRRYGQDLTQMARDGKLDTVIGRDREIERAVTVLCRRTKSNPVLIGEAGVGKTAIVEGLATRIAKDEVPGSLIGKRIYQVDLSSVVAGTKFRGEFEERIKGIIDEAMEDKNLILFIDEIHLLMGAGSGEGSMDAANILKPALARGQIRLIGATTMDEYRKSIEKDKALARRFQIIQVDEPSPAVTLRILKGVKSHYEKHHGVIIPDAILETAIVMSNRYINDRFMPDKVIDVIDEASAIAKVAADKKGGGEYKKLKIEIKTLEDKQEIAANEEDFERAAMCKTRIKQLEKAVEKLEKAGAKNLENPAIKEEDLANAISLKTGIPVTKVHGSEKDLLLKLEDRLNKEVIGQEEAVRDVAKAIRRGRSGISDPRRPIGSFLFMGPTGVGKTELARVIAKEVFGGDNALIKIDMSEFGEKHNVSRLVGAPAGYVGYDDGGKLTEAVRRHPYSVVLFDEIEKAHPDVFNMLLQVLEDGVLTDGQGNKVKFNNTVVILTSNLGAAEMYDDQEFGFSVRTKADEKKLALEYEDSKNAAMRELKKVMRPELINRLDAIEVFHALTRKQVEQIFNNLIEDLKKRLAEKSIGLKLKDEVKDFLIEKGYDPKNGARPLRRAIEDYLGSELSEVIFNESVKKGEVLAASLVKDRIKIVALKKEK